MAKMPEIQKSGTQTRRYNAPDMAKIVARSTLTGNNYTCPVCSASIPRQHYQQHLADVHGCVNKEPFIK